ncbi:helix-turn-helix transcriptional regulator [Roseomonas sp. BN140053]|uniref:helix-turn-helix transcriptional regulator n=1 Tax=Roseomonas sp. BN140053 TaxID=3391898 RepID=UPI0039E8F863
MAKAEVDYLLRIAEVEKQSGLTRSSIYRRIKEGTFPAPRALGAGQVRWPQSEVTRWQEGLPLALQQSCVVAK